MLDSKLHALRDLQDRALAKEGFFIHAVLDDEDYPQRCNVHTHGLAENFAHPDLQICVPMSRDFLSQIMHNAVDLIRAGTPLLPGTSSHELIEPYAVHFIAASEGGRPVVRLIFPDTHGRYEDGTWAWQYEQLHLDELPSDGT